MELPDTASAGSVDLDITARRVELVAQRGILLLEALRLQPQPPLRLSHEHASSRHTQTFIAAARSSAPRALLGLTVPR